MVAWQRNRYLDPGIWEHFQSRINPAVLPDDISALQLAPPTGQSAVLSYMVNVFTVRKRSYVFTRVCHSVHRGGVCLSACWDTHPHLADTPG